MTNPMKFEFLKIILSHSMLVSRVEKGGRETIGRKEKYFYWIFMRKIFFH